MCDEGRSLFGFEGKGDRVLSLRGDRCLVWSLGDQVLGDEGAIAV